MRTLSNLLIITFVAVTVYTLRSDLMPALQNVRTAVEYSADKIGLGNYFDYHQITRFITPSNPPATDQAQPNGTPPTSVHTPGPLDETFYTGLKNENDEVLTASDIVYWTNQARQKNGGLAALTVNETLNETATAKASDMLAKQYFEHISPTGKNVGDQVTLAGYHYIMIGENLAMGDFANAQKLVTAWMNSPGHRANILNKRYKEIGIGILQGTYNGHTVWMAVQHFGLPQTACPTIDNDLKLKIQANEKQINDLEVRIKNLEAQENTLDHTSYINQYNILVNQHNTLVTTTKNEVTDYNNQIKAFNICIQGI